MPNYIMGMGILGTAWNNGVEVRAAARTHQNMMMITIILGLIDKLGIHPLIKGSIGLVFDHWRQYCKV